LNVGFREKLDIWPLLEFKTHLNFLTEGGNIKKGVLYWKILHIQRVSVVLLLKKVKICLLQAVEAHRVAKG
jgi:hypothetical protein